MTAQKAGEEGRDPAILVEGFLVFTTLPSHRMLQARFQEVFQEVRIGDKMIKLVRGYFFNKIKTLNGKYYTRILPENTISPMPGFYLLPINRVPAFQKAKEELLEEYTIYEQELRDFLTYGKIPEGKREDAEFYEEYTVLLQEWAEEQGAKLDLRSLANRISIVDRIDIRLIPLRLEPAIFEEYLEERYRKSVERVDAETARLLEAAKNDVERTRKELTEKAMITVKAEIDNIMQRLLEVARHKLTKRALNSAVKTLDRIAEMAESAGCLPAIGDRVRRAEQMFRAIKVDDEEKIRFLAADTLESIDDLSPRVRTLLRNVLKG